MDRDNLRSFIKTAEAAVMSARGSLLLISQGGAKFDLAPLAAQLGNIAEIAAGSRLFALAEQAENCQAAIAGVTDPAEAYKALDAISAVEAELLSITLPGEMTNVAEFVEE